MENELNNPMEEKNNPGENTGDGSQNEPGAPKDEMENQTGNSDEGLQNDLNSMYNPDSKVDSQELIEILNASMRIKKEIEKVIVGQENLIEMMLAALFAGGHILIEGVPGIAKTIAAKCFSRAISSGFSRIQFTPDLMPSDIIGTSVFDQKKLEFQFKHGPVFSNIVLIDEINRSPAKTQAALFEVMEERQISFDGITYKMDEPFMVLATQNPIEQEGTYKLPEAQLDRFLFRVKMDYPSLQQEKDILMRFREDFKSETLNEVQPVIKGGEIETMRNIVERIYIKDELCRYIAEIIHKTRNSGDLFLGASPRASLAILRASKALAAINGREFVTPEDIKKASPFVLNHRLILTSERELEGVQVEEVIEAISNQIEIPR